MYIVDVIPLKRIPLPSPQVLSYFTSHLLEQGSLVLVSLRKKKVPAIVLSKSKVSAKKIEIKRAEYQLKPILKVIQKKPVLPLYEIELAEWISNSYWSPLAKVFSLFFPNPLFKKIINNSLDRYQERPLKKEKDKISKKLIICQSEFLPEEEIKRKLQEKRQVLFLIPEESKKEFWMKRIYQITPETCFFSNSLPSRKYLEGFEKIKNGQIKVIVGTRSALFAPFKDLGLIILLEEENKNYKQDREPRYNAKQVSEKLAEFWQADLVFLSSFPSIESYWLAKNKRYNLINKKVDFHPSESIGIDMRKIKPWRPISPSLIKEIKKTLSERAKIILFLNRKGSGTSVLCQDCGWVKKCAYCEMPMTYHFKERKMICHHCGYKAEIPEQCEKCKSWRLISLGIGIEKAERELRRELPEVKILRLDKEIASKVSEQKKILKEFSESGDILITTSILFQYLPFPYHLPSVGLAGLISIDSLLSLPDFRAEEEGARIIQKLLSLHPKRFVFQTFFPHSKSFLYLTKGYDSFFQEVLREREAFFYPPFSKLIKLTFSHKDQEKAENEARLLKEKLLLSKSQGFMAQPKVSLLGPAPGFVPKFKGKYVWNILIKLPVDNYRSLIRVLLTEVPPNWKVDIDPVSIL